MTMTFGWVEFEAGSHLVTTEALGALQAALGTEVPLDSSRSTSPWTEGVPIRRSTSRPPGTRISDLDA